jgi:hypothetical protein
MDVVVAAAVVDVVDDVAMVRRCCIIPQVCHMMH